MQCFEGYRGKFELDSPFDGQPVELSEKFSRLTPLGYSTIDRTIADHIY